MIVMTEKQLEHLYEMLGEMAAEREEPVNWNGGIEI
jgi:hypothetical protein